MQQTDNFKEYIVAFEKKLELVAIDDITTVLYCKNYLSHLLKHKKYYLSIYADVLYKLIHHSSKDKASITLIDYGAGNGLLGMFAKFCGFKKVFLSDIDANFIHASEKLAVQLNIKIDAFVTGDISALQQYFKSEIPDAIAGTDVIEHIYDLQIFFKGLQQMNQSIISVFTTASNPANYFKLRMLKKIQLKDELEGGTPDAHILFGNAPLGPFLKIREQIIRKHFDLFSDEKIRELAKATRGLIEQDIIAAIEQYKMSGKLPNPQPLGTNTCDPLSGSWTGRILSFKAYTLIYNSAGFTPVFYNGFYNVYESGFKKYVKKMLNAGIAVFGIRLRHTL